MKYGSVEFPAPPSFGAQKIIFPFCISDEPREVQERRLRVQARALYERIENGPWLAGYVGWNWPETPNAVR